jgi:hypothetical protein
MGLDAEARAQWQRGVALWGTGDADKLRRMSSAVASTVGSELELGVERLYLDPADR